ncbi:MAG: amino acid adenylation domain-containing protein [Opitutales bacterium]|nr:amino acid adenylation domain-containing protein [Opitutales bacterium]
MTKAEILQKLLEKKGLKKQPAPRIPKRPNDAAPRLSFAQQRLWFVQQMAPGSTAYNLPAAWDIEGPFDIERLRTAFHKVIERHEILRTRFPTDGHTIELSIAETTSLEIPLIPIARTDHAAIQAHEAAVLFAPFSLNDCPLLRATVLQFGPESYRLLVCIHHLVFDGWSISVLMKEISALYAGNTLPALSHRYYDFAHWQRSQCESGRWEAAVNYWEKELAGLAPVDFPTDRPRHSKATDPGAIHRFGLPQALLNQVTTLSSRLKTTPFNICLSAWQVLVGRYARTDDVAIGSPVAGRNVAEWESLLGYFNNMLVLRSDLGTDPSFAEFTQRTHNKTQQALAHQNLPFEVVVEHLSPERHLDQNPLFQIAFSFQNLPSAQLAMDGLSWTPINLPQHEAKFDLLLALEESEGQLQGSLEYSTQLFDTETIERLIENYATLLRAACKNPEQSISHLPLTSETERTLVGQRPLPRKFDLEDCIHERFIQRARKAPDRIAISDGKRSITYGVLEQKSAALAQHLIGRQLPLESIIGIHLERSIETVIAIIGILRAGHAYLPLDVHAPKSRLRYVVEDSGTALILSARSTQRQQTAAQIVFLEDALESTAPYALPEVPPDTLAYVIYTSGSTGKPKGVMIPHRNVTRLFDGTHNWFNFGPNDVWSLFHAFSFDFSVWELWGALAYGGRVALIPYWVSRSTDKFYKMLESEGVTVLSQTPSAFRQLTQHITRPDHPTQLQLKWVIFGGEALDLSSLKPWFEHFPEDAPRLVNMYGITETTVHVTYREIRKTDVLSSKGSLIGKPIPDLSIHILDEQLQPVPCGVIGEIYVGGAGLARGYLNRPELTQERFINNPIQPDVFGQRLYRTGDLARYLSDGDISYQGRSDFQVQVKGFRIELGEIQAALATLPSIKENAVLAWTDAATSSTFLTAYCVTDQGDPFDVADLRAALSEHIPEYMIPAHFVSLDALPLTENNKLDRDELAKRKTTEVEVTPTTRESNTPAEHALVQAISEVIGGTNFPVDANLFALGIDSILMLQVRARFMDLGFRFELQDAFRHQTIAALASAAEQSAGPDLEATMQPFVMVDPKDRQNLSTRVVDAYPLSALQQGMLFHSELYTDSAIYHDIFSYRLRAVYDEERIKQAVRFVVERHPVLRTAILREGLSQPLQCVFDSVELPLQNYDISGESDNQQRDVIERWIDAEKARVYDWTVAPLIRMATHRVAESEWYFSLSLHHSILDGWSVSTLLAELFDHYLNGPPDLSAPRTSFAAFVKLEQACIQNQASQEFWTQQLEDAQHLPLPVWPEHRRDDVQTHAASAVIHSWKAGELQRLEHLARTHQAPLQTLLLALHAKVMSVTSNQRDVLTGLIANGRPETEDGDKILGLFLNTAPFRINVGHTTWSKLIQSCLQTEEALLPHRRFPLAEIQRLTHQRELCETAFNFVHFHVLDKILASPEIELLETRYFDENNFALFAQFSINPDTGHLDLELKYDIARFDVKQMAAILSLYSDGVEAMLRDAKLLHDSTPLVNQLPSFISGEHQERDPALLLHHFVEIQAAEHGDRIAIRGGSEAITYAELNSQANQVAHQLLARGICLEGPVGIFMGRSPNLLAGILGVLKVGATYVPLDPNYPEARLSYLFNDACMACVITEQILVDSLPENTPYLLIETIEGPDYNPGISPHSDQLAYIIYTSGSTGKPKGTAISHSNAVAMVQWAQTVYSEADVAGMLASTSICFDLSIFEFFLTFAQGGSLILAENALALPEHAHRSEVTLVNTVPSAAAELLRQDGFPESVRIINLAGEPLKRGLSDALYAIPQIKSVYDLYGPSEDTTYSTFIRRSAGGPETIGTPVANTTAYLLDTALNPVPLGTVGELFLSGEGITRGYHRRPHLTAERYLPNPFSSMPGTRMYRTGDLARLGPDGNFEFLGRSDHQVKIRGFRIELGEIQNALEQVDAISEAAVSAHEDERGNKRLVAYVAAADSQCIEDARIALARSLPEYMVPAQFIVLETLPRTPNGKLDRKALPDPAQSFQSDERSITLARNDTEAALVKIWQEVLSETAVGIEDNFFSLGGDSILMIQIVSKAREAGFILNTRQLFDHQTIAELAAVIQLQQDDTSTIDVSHDGALQSTPIQRWFFDQNFETPGHWNQSILLRSRQPIDTARLEACIETLLNHHASLRLRAWSGSIRVLPPESCEGDARVMTLNDLGLAQRTAPCAALQESLDLENGPVFRVARFTTADVDRLFITIHHLAVDGVSWRILLEDLDKLYSVGPGYELQRSASLRVWTQALNPEAFENERSHWQAEIAEQPSALSPDSADSANTYANERRLEQSLSEELTEQLLRKAPEAYNTQINDLLLAALSAALATWSDQSAHAIHLEGHGREDTLSSLDISRTTGWFTTLYPIRLAVPPEHELGALIRSTKEYLRSLPSRGVGYGFLRHLASPAIPESQAQITFNYLGQTGLLTREGQAFQPCDEDRGPDFGLKNTRPHELDISAIVINERLCLDIRFAENRWLTDRMERLLKAFVTALTDVIEHCVQKQDTQYTPSDFALADLDQDDLDDALDEIEF